MRMGPPLSPYSCKSVVTWTRTCQLGKTVAVVEDYSGRAAAASMKIIIPSHDLLPANVTVTFLGHCYIAPNIDLSHTHD